MACLDCLDRGALAIDGRPRMFQGLPLTAGCEECKGKGFVLVPLGKYQRFVPRSRSTGIPPEIAQRDLKIQGARVLVSAASVSI
jgi:hypothetical protein